MPPLNSRKNGFKVLDTRQVKRQSMLTQEDLMTPSFLNAIAAPAIYTTFLDLLDVWEEKSRVAKGHPFRGSKDVYRAALDAAWSIVFGTDINKSATRASIRSLASIHALSLPSDIDAEVTIPEPEVPTSMSAVMELTGGLEKIVVSPVPRLAHWLLRKTPSYRKAAKIKDDLVGEEIAKTVKRFEGRDEKDMDIRCALDDMIRRETIAATKDERPPLFQSRAMADEVSNHHSASSGPPIHLKRSSVSWSAPTILPALL